MAAICSRAKCALRIKLHVCVCNKYNLHRRISALTSLRDNNCLQSQNNGRFAVKRNFMLPTKIVVNFHSLPMKLQKIVPFNLSDIGEGIREVTVKEWFVEVGDSVAQFDKICEVQSDKASVTITSRFDGKITKLYHEVDGTALVGQPLIDIELAGVAAEQVVVEKQVPANDNAAFSPTDGKSLATPAVRRIAAENQVKLSSVSGSGKKGRVLKEDIMEYLKSGGEPSAASQKPTRQTAAHGDVTQPVSGYVKAMVKTMTEARKIPHLTYSDEINVSELVRLCARLRQATQTSGVKITYMPFFIKATSTALKQFSILNSSVDASCENITLKASHNVGVAMDTPDGLIVPNVKRVQDLSIYEIAIELKRLHTLGLQRGIGIQDLTGGTITLSNIGAIGGTYCVPVILPPEVAIAALGRVQTLPRFDDNGNVVRAHVLHVSWSADHRVVDGATVAKFSNVWKELIENPEVLMLGA